MRFLIDMPLSPELARWLGANGHDAVHASAMRLDRASDTEIIAQAATDGRIIVTADLDYPRLLATARATGPGVILFRSGDWLHAETITRMADILGSVPEMDLDNSILVVERERIRRRRLPIK